MSNTARFGYYPRPKVRYKGKSTEEREAVLERLREFLRLNYMTGQRRLKRLAANARQLGYQLTPIAV